MRWYKRKLGIERLPIVITSKSSQINHSQDLVAVLSCICVFRGKLSLILQKDLSPFVTEHCRGIHIFFVSVPNYVSHACHPLPLMDTHTHRQTLEILKKEKKKKEKKKKKKKKPLKLVKKPGNENANIWTSEIQVKTWKRVSLHIHIYVPMTVWIH